MGDTVLYQSAGYTLMKLFESRPVEIGSHITIMAIRYCTLSLNDRPDVIRKSVRFGTRIFRKIMIYTGVQAHQ